MTTRDRAKSRTPEFSVAKEALDAALANDQLPSCALDEAGIRAQQARHARLAPSVTNFERQGESVLFCFAEDYDRQALEEMVAVEKQCCPFFEFAFDQGTRELRVSVNDEELLPALEAIAFHLGARWEAQQRIGRGRKADSPDECP
jgi:hypothetical protein